MTKTEIEALADLLTKWAYSTPEQQTDSPLMAYQRAVHTSEQTVQAETVIAYVLRSVATDVTALSQEDFRQGVIRMLTSVCVSASSGPAMPVSVDSAPPSADNSYRFLPKGAPSSSKYTPPSNPPSAPPPPVETTCNLL